MIIYIDKFCLDVDYTEHPEQKYGLEQEPISQYIEIDYIEHLDENDSFEYIQYLCDNYSEYSDYEDTIIKKIEQEIEHQKEP